MPTLHLPIRPGDIVLTRRTGFGSVANLTGQAQVTARRARFTHAAVCVAPGVLLDARLFEHIQLRNVVDEVAAGALTGEMARQGRMLAMRAARLQHDRNAIDDLAVGLLAPTYAQLSKRYNWLFTRPQASDGDPLSDEAKFAYYTELCTLVLREEGILPADWPMASATFPVHYEALAQSKDWVDVTDEWVRQLDTMQADLADIDAPGSDRTRQFRATAQATIDVTLTIAAAEKTNHQQIERMAEQVRLMLSVKGRPRGFPVGVDALVAKVKRRLKRR